MTARCPHDSALPQTFRADAEAAASATMIDPAPCDDPKLHATDRPQAALRARGFSPAPR